MEKKGITAKQIEQYDKLIATHPDIEKKGKSMLYTSMNGHMFSIFSSDAKLGIRLSKDDREAFIEKYNSELLKSHGAVMREYVTIPDDLLKNTQELQSYLAKSYDYVKSLKPKATTKKKK